MIPAPYVALAAVLALAGAYAYGRHDGRQIESAAQAKAEAVAEASRDAMIAAAVEAMKTIRPVYTTINKGLEKEFRSEVRYTSPDCSHTPESWRMLDTAYQAAGGEPFAGGSGVSAPASPAGPDARGDD